MSCPFFLNFLEISVLGGVALKKSSVILVVWLASLLVLLNAGLSEFADLTALSIISLVIMSSVIPISTAALLVSISELKLVTIHSLSSSPLHISMAKAIWKNTVV